MAGRSPRRIKSRMRELALTAIALKLRGVPPESIVTEIIAEATRIGLPGGYPDQRGLSMAAVFPNEGRIDWDGMVWAFVPHDPEG